MPIILLTILTSGVILGYLFSQKKVFLLLSFILIIPFFIIQIKQTKITDFLHLNEIETIDQINRMHQYPNYAFRIGHILEERRESIVLFKLDKNFTDTFNLLLFPNPFLTLFVLPFFIFGFFKSISKNPIFSLVLLCLPLLLFTLIGHQNSSGPICFYPIILAYSLYSLIPSKLLKYEK